MQNYVSHKLMHRGLLVRFEPINLTLHAVILSREVSISTELNIVIPIPRRLFTDLDFSGGILVPIGVGNDDTYLLRI